ncbi:MAG TPA: EamA family transporter [Acidobacteriota bacterium]|nr:EamA family transporter [Acidobacteriota bacterium]
MKTAVVLTIAIFSQAIGNIFLSKAMKAVGTGIAGNHGIDLVLQALQNPGLILGTVLLILFFVLYSAALSWADLSFVLPATSFGYILNVAFAHHFLGEPVSSVRWAGTLLIAAGVILVSRSGGSNEKKLQEAL